MIDPRWTVVVERRREGKSRKEEEDERTKTKPMIFGREELGSWHVHRICP